MMSKKTVAVIGAGGFVGKSLCDAFEKDASVELVRVERNNYESLKNGQYDIVINSAMPSKRFWAEQNPAQDFQETIQKTADLIYGWKYQKFIQISSVSARMQRDTVYGRHKAAAENLCNSKMLVIRLTSMYGEGLSKGALIDILNRRKVYLNGESRYSFTPIEFVGAWLVRNLERTGIVEVGAGNSVTLQEIADVVQEKIQFEGALDIQEIQNPEKDFPDARNVLHFIKKKKKEMHANL
jgi:nucleoside-diphosphate-sugar epimerase